MLLPMIFPTKEVLAVRFGRRSHKAGTTTPPIINDITSNDIKSILFGRIFNLNGSTRNEG